MIRVAIAGIPNCGKSTIINRMVGRNAAIVGDKPGVTRGQQQVDFFAKISFHKKNVIEIEQMF